MRLADSIPSGAVCQLRLLPAAGRARGSPVFQPAPRCHPDLRPPAPREDWYPVLNLRSRSWLGYKYFNFGAGPKEGQRLKLVLTLKENLPGRVNVYASAAKAKYHEPEQPKVLIGTIELKGLDNTVHTVEGTLDSTVLKGRKGIYLEFLAASDNEEICQLNKLQFVVETED